jgi:hypothetical protein
MDKLEIPKLSKKEFLREKLRQKIQMKKDRRTAKICKKIQYKNLRAIDLDINTICRHLIMDVAKCKKNKSQIQLATKFRAVEKYEKLFQKFPKIFTAIIKKDMTMKNIGTLEMMLRERQRIEHGDITIDESMYAMGQHLFNQHTNKEEIEKLRKQRKN